MTHFLSVRLPFPILFWFVVPFLVTSIFGSYDKNLIEVFRSIFWIIAIGLGTIYGAKHINKNCIISNKNDIIKLSLIYFFIFDVFWKIFNGTSVAGLIAFPIGVLVFYFISKKYIKENK